MAVGGISKSNIDELRSLKAPPELVAIVLKGVLRIFGIMDSSWNTMKNFLKDRTILDQILDFDPRRITPEMRRDC